MIAKRSWLAAVLVCLVTESAAARPHPGARDAWAERFRKQPTRVASIDNDKQIDINNISMFVTNTGSFAYDKMHGAGFEFPKGTGKTAMFAAGLWMGAKVNGAIRIALSEYSDEYGPGAIVGRSEERRVGEEGRSRWSPYH